MRVAAIQAQEVLPIHRFESDRLDDVVVIAGPNGVGKSHLIDALLQKFQNPTGSPQVQLRLEATNTEELTEWGKNVIDTSIPDDAQRLARTLQKNRSRRSWNSSVIHFESDRSIQQVQAYAFTWDINDPWLENVGWNQTFSGLKARFQDTLHSLFRKVQSHEKEIARRAIAMQKEGSATMPLDFGDPLQSFKDAFELLVAPKKLLDPDPRQQRLAYEYEGQQHPLSSLSSGEREVVNIVFDFILRTSSDCIIFFDEPELHLHPELSYKLLQALQSAGKNNQFIFCTHSPDIITASLNQTVIFLAPPKKDPAGQWLNQAIRMEEDDSTNQALKLLGQSIGIVALGRRLVLIEGVTSSLDKQTYGFLLRNRFPGLVLVPTGGKDLIRSFGQVVESVLDKTLWGVDFFMLCDRDSADAQDIVRLEEDSGGRLRFLGRYHLENYFLEADIISKMFTDMVADDNWLRDPAMIDRKLRELAGSSLSYATALIVSSRVRRQVGNVSLMPKGAHDKSVDELVQLMTARGQEELLRATAALNVADIEAAVRNVFEELKVALADSSDKWKVLIPGKQVLAQFAAVAGLDLAKFKLKYMATVAAQGSSIFDEVVGIFAQFAATPGAQDVTPRPTPAARVTG